MPHHSRSRSLNTTTSAAHSTRMSADYLPPSTPPPAYINPVRHYQHGNDEGVLLHDVTDSSTQIRTINNVQHHGATSTVRQNGATSSSLLPGATNYVPQNCGNGPIPDHGTSNVTDHKNSLSAPTTPVMNTNKTLTSAHQYQQLIGITNVKVYTKNIVLMRISHNLIAFIIIFIINKLPIYCSAFWIKNSEHTGIKAESHNLIWI